VARRLVAANWKMNGSLASNASLVEEVLGGLGGLGGAVVLCVPHPYLAQVGALLKGSKLGLAGQDLSEHEAGAYTGEVSAGMLADLGCSHVVIGHSERRAYHHESDTQVLAKVRRALLAGLTPIVCVGESREQREAGETDRVVLGQVEAVCAGLDDAAVRRIVLAYEPIWAIGSGLAATPQMAQEVHAAIRAALRSRIGEDAAELPLLYGGSVNAGNASSLFEMQDIDGALVGGASLDAEAFVSICAANAAR